jgi:hypothetical protein
MGSRKVKSPDEILEELINKGIKGTSLGWSHQECYGKGFGIACQSFVRVWKRIQNPSPQQHQNVIAQVVGWENPNPTTNWRKLGERLPTITLDKCSCHFRGEIVTSRGESR